MNFVPSKQQLRQTLRRELKQMSSQERSDTSRKIVGILERKISENFPAGSMLLFFAPRPDFSEPDILPLFETCKKVYCCAFPKITDLKQRAMQALAITSSGKLREAEEHFSLREPEDGVKIAPEEFDLVFLPTLGIDRNGNRLGYGQGYYDRFLKQVRTDCQKWAIVFSKQRVEKIPEEAHDVRATAVIDETGFYPFSS